jgi:pimeloyl-ACP methyl ester carboxylesterase
MDWPKLDVHRGGTGEPLLLVHGLGHTWRGWKPMLPLLERRFDVLAVDLPGFGHSPPLPDGVEPTAEALADAVEGELDAAGLAMAHVAGNSLGGWIAFELARRRRARTVTAISPLGLGLPRENQWGAALLRGMRWLARNSPAPEPLLRSPVGRTLFAGPALGRPWRADPDDLVEQGRLYGEAPGFLTTLDATFNRRPAGLTQLDCPVLLLWGSRDVLLLPRQGRRFERLIPCAELRYLKGLGHTPMSDGPELLTEAIADFALRTRPERRAGAPG